MKPSERIQETLEERAKRQGCSVNSLPTAFRTSSTLNCIVQILDDAHVGEDGSAAGDRRDRGYEYLERWQSWAREIAQELGWVDEMTWPDDTRFREQAGAQLRQHANATRKVCRHCGSTRSMLEGGCCADCGEYQFTAEDAEAQRKARHEFLHRCVDEMLAAYLQQTKNDITHTTLWQFLEWSGNQAKEPSHEP